MGGWRRWTVLAGVFAVLLAGWQLSSPAQPAAARNRFEFQVVESFDAQYLGDTPGHIGRGGGLGRTIPDVALGDPVYHERGKIGTVTRVIWDRTKESLEVEFDPEPLVRVSVGESAWIQLGGADAERKAR